MRAAIPSPEKLLRLPLRHRVVGSFFLLVCLVKLVRADVITLKNGRTLEGLIVRETDVQIVLDFGVGSTTVARRQIERMVRSSPEDAGKIRDGWRKANLLHPKYIPEGLGKWAAGFYELVGLREQAVRARQLLLPSDGQEEKIQAELSRLQKEHLEMSRELKQTAAYDGNAAEYNRKVAGLNALIAEMTIRRDELAKKRDGKEAARSTISRYLETFRKYRVSFDQELSNRKTGNVKEDEFFDFISDQLKPLRNETLPVTLKTRTKQGATVVTGLLNGSVEGDFIVDTGAEMVTISQRLANRLELDTKLLKDVELVLADGKKTQGKTVVLRSVQVGAAHAENVEAVLLADPPGDHVDGLLGMSFFQNFIMRLDGASGQLQLEQFNPN